MELAFILAAVRRYLWVVVVMGVLGAVPGLARDVPGVRYEARGLLQVVPPVDAAPAYAGDPDRYVISQLSILESTSTAAAVAERVGNIDPATVAGLVSFEHEAKTDIVGVIAATDDPEFSARLVDAYLDEYVAAIQWEIERAQEPVDQQIEEARAQLEEVNAAIASAMAPYLEARETPAGSAFPPVPGIDQVTPSLASSQSMLISTLVELRRERGRVQSNSRTAGVIVQRASAVPGLSAGSRWPFVAAGVAVGLFLGTLAAVIIARLSPKLLDESQAEEVLGRSLLGSLPRQRSLRSVAELESARHVDPLIESLSVRVEALARRTGPATVLVTGTEPGAGASTVARALASRSAAHGSRVVLVLIDDGPLPAPPRSESSLSIVQLDPESAATVSRRDLDDQLGEWAKRGDIVVVDGGPLLSSATTLEMARQCDLVILVVAERQDVRTLGEIADELANRQVLAVWNSSRRRLRERVLGGSARDAA